MAQLSAVSILLSHVRRVDRAQVQPVKSVRETGFLTRNHKEA